jgi:hypothetical protein
MGMEDLETGTQDLTDEAIESLVSDTERSTNLERPMTKEEPAKEAAAPAAKGKATKDAFDLEFDYKGQKIKADREKAIKWASQGYDYAQRMADFNKRAQEFEAKQKSISELEAKLDPYRKADEFFAKNPDKWQRIEAELKAAQLGAQDQNDPALKVLEKIQPELDSLKQFKTQFETEQQKKQREADDAKLMSEREAIQKKYPDLALDTPDENGQSMEYRVLEYAQQHGLRSFEQAFKLYNHERLLEVAQAKAKEAVGKETQRKTKLGLLGKSSAPTKDIRPPRDLKNQSYEDILAEINEERQQGLYG